MQRHTLPFVALATAVMLAGIAPRARGEGTVAAAQSADQLRPVERTFIVEVAETAREHAELSRLGVSQSSSSRLRDLAQQLVADYSGISAALETLARRKTVPLPLQPTSFSDRYRELAASSGAAFDRAFVREAVAANQRVLRLCEAAVAHARDADVRDTAGSLLPVIRDHMNKSSALANEL